MTAKKMGRPTDPKTETYKVFFKRSKDSTRKQNAYRLRTYCEWLKTSPSQLIEDYQIARQKNDLDNWERKQINRVMQFYNCLIEEYKQKDKEPNLNTVRTKCAGILAFYKENCTSLPDVTKSFAPPQMPKNEYRFSQDDLRKMFYFGDTEEKALVSLAVSYAQGAKEFLSLECEMLARLVQEAKDKGLTFISWQSKARAKTSIQPISFLTQEAIESVDAYLQVLTKKHGKLPKYIWCNSKPDKFITNEGLNKKVRRLVNKANINTYGKRVHFHLFRKFTFSRLRRIDRDIAKIICAKQVSSSDMTYEEIESQCDKVFKLAYKHISLNGDVTGKQRQKQTEEIKELKQGITSLQTELHALRTREKVALEKIKELTDYLAQLDEALHHHKNKEFREIYEEIKEELGIKIEANTQRLMMIMKHLGLEEKQK